MYDCCTPCLEPVVELAPEPFVEPILDPVVQPVMPPAADVLPADPVPTVPEVQIFNPLAPTLADINGKIDASMTNIINPYPGYTAQWDSSSNSMDFYEPGRLTPSF